MKAETAVKPTEDEEKVRRVLRNLFPASEIQRLQTHDGDVKLQLTGEDVDCLSTLRNLIKQERIRSAARSMLVKSTTGNHLRFFLNKQAAFAGRVSFCETADESPNGPVIVQIEAPDTEMIIDFLAARPGEGLYKRH